MVPTQAGTTLVTAALALVTVAKLTAGWQGWLAAGRLQCHSSCLLAHEEFVSIPQTEAAFQPAVSCGATASAISVASRRMIVSRPCCPTLSGYGGADLYCRAEATAVHAQ